MIDSPEPVATVRHDSAGVAWSQVIAILAAAVALGLVYNVASPLGVRVSKPGGQITSPLVNSNTPALPLTAPIPSGAASETSPPAALTPNASNSVVRWGEIKPWVEAGQIVLVDGRPKTAYDLEHIPGAVSLPAESEPAEFVAFAAKHPLNAAIVVYCGSDNCDAAHELAEKLRQELGYTNVREMPGGVVEYRVAESRTTPAGAQ